MQHNAFAALKADGSVVVWGHSDYGGDCSTLNEIQMPQINWYLQEPSE